MVQVKHLQTIFSVFPRGGGNLEITGWWYLGKWRTIKPSADRVSLSIFIWFWIFSSALHWSITSPQPSKNDSVWPELTIHPITASCPCQCACQVTPWVTLWFLFSFQGRAELPFSDFSSPRHVHSHAVICHD